MFTPRSCPHLPRVPRAPSPSPPDPQYKTLSPLLINHSLSLSLSLSLSKPQTRRKKERRKKERERKKKKKMLDAILSYLTPAVLFLLLNLVIGTIAFTSYRGPRNEAGPTSRLSRSPSLVFERLKSFNLYSSHRPTEPQTVEIPEPESKPQPEPDENRNITRSQSDTKPAAGEMPAKLAKKLKKSATLKSAFNHFEFEPAEKRRPATMRERVPAVEEAEEVNARADDFINRFKQQLKLQRLDSLIRYKEMISRGS